MQIGIVRKEMCHPVFRPLGRMTYCAYLVHPIVLRVFLGTMRQPLYVDDFTIVAYVMCVLVVSYLLAFVICVCLEFPISALQKHFFAGKLRGSKYIKQYVIVFYVSVYFCCSHRRSNESSQAK